MYPSYSPKLGSWFEGDSLECRLQDSKASTQTHGVLYNHLVGIASFVTFYMGASALPMPPCPGQWSAPHPSRSLFALLPGHGGNRAGKGRCWTTVNTHKTRGLAAVTTYPHRNHFETWMKQTYFWVLVPRQRDCCHFLSLSDGILSLWPWWVVPRGSVSFLQFLTFMEHMGLACCYVA